MHEGGNRGRRPTRCLIAEGEVDTHGIAGTPLMGIGHWYRVTAKNSAGQMVQPSKAYTISIGYSANQVSSVLELTLALYFWDGAQWKLEPTSGLDAAGRLVSAMPAHILLWVVLGQPRPDQGTLYLPVVRRK